MARNRHTKSLSVNPIVDICILTAGRFDTLRNCIAAAEREASGVPSRILLMDNGSDRQFKMKNVDLFEHENIEYKRSEINTGYPAGYNELISKGNSPLVLVLTDDVVLQPGALDSLIRTMDNPEIGMCGLKLIFPNESSDPARPAGKIQHVGISCNLRGEPFHIFMGWDANHPKLSEPRQVFAVTGACFIIRRSLFNKAGGFYEGYGRGTFEDIELSLTVRELGYKIYVDTNAVATHYVGATAEMLQLGFPLQSNYAIFKQRNSQRLFWSEALDW